MCGQGAEETAEPDSCQTGQLALSLSELDVCTLAGNKVTGPLSSPTRGSWRTGDRALKTDFFPPVTKAG